MPPLATWDAIRATENVLRDLIERLLGSGGGEQWFEQSGLKSEAVKSARSRRDKERATRDGGRVNERIIYYANWGDLRKIIASNWTTFADCFGDQEATLDDLDRLEIYRNPEAHHRELLDFEEHLVLGVTGEIRNKVTIYLSEQGGESQYFPRIESATDSFGNEATNTTGSPDYFHCTTGLTLNPGSSVTFRLRAWDPEGGPWDWRIDVNGDTEGFDHDGDRITWHVTKDHIGQPTQIEIRLISQREYHRHGGKYGFDGVATFHYDVLPSPQ